MQAALGRSQLRKLSSFIARRQAIAAVYNRAFAPLGLAIPATGNNRTHIYYRYVLRHGDAWALMAALEGLGIAARRPIFRPLHAYLGKKGYPEAERAWRETLSLPLYPSLSEDETDRIVTAMTSLFAKGLERHVLL
jgi:dTDP-4-amino-4,6-dideoxygalactose transaminase